MKTFRKVKDYYVGDFLIEENGNYFDDIAWVLYNIIILFVAWVAYPFNHFSDEKNYIRRNVYFEEVKSGKKKKSD